MSTDSDPKVPPGGGAPHPTTSRPEEEAPAGAFSKLFLVLFPFVLLVGLLLLEVYLRGRP